MVHTYTVIIYYKERCTTRVYTIQHHSPYTCLLVSPLVPAKYPQERNNPAPSIDDQKTTTTPKTPHTLPIQKGVQI